MGGPFSLRCLSPLGSPAVGAGQTQMAMLGMLRCGSGGFATQKNRIFYSAMAVIEPVQMARRKRVLCSLGIFAEIKASVISNPRWPLLRAMRPVAEWRSFLSNHHEATPDRRAARPVAERRPWGRKRQKREAFRRAFLERLAYLYIPRALWARCGVKGHCPLLEEDADHAAVAFVDDLAESLLYFLLGVYGHPHQLVGKPLPDQFV